MNILVCIYDCNSVGGIVNHTVNLVEGLTEIGHKVHFVKLMHKDTTFRGRKEPPEDQKHEWGYCKAGKFWYHQEKGFISNVFEYMSEQMLHAWKHMANGYDAVIWTVPVPGYSKQLAGNLYWRSLYSLKTKQYAFIHDGNIQKMIPHIFKLRNRLDGLLCVHECAYNSAHVMPVPRILLVNPQKLNTKGTVPWAKKKRGLFSLQTFKAWKRVHELLKALPHLPKTFKKHIAGGGIEWYYLTSKDKVKDHYVGVWDGALKAGMDFHGYVTPERRDEILDEVRILIDPSYSDSYIKHGAHFNRVIVDAMQRDCIPMAVEAMTEGKIFKAGRNYLPIDRSSPEAYAKCIKAAVNLSDKEAQKIIRANRRLLKQFDRKNVAQRLVDFINCEIEGEIGTPTQKFISDSKKLISKFRG